MQANEATAHKAQSSTWILCKWIRHWWLIQPSPPGPRRQTKHDPLSFRVTIIIFHMLSEWGLSAHGRCLHFLILFLQAVSCSLNLTVFTACWFGGGGAVLKKKTPPFCWFRLFNFWTLWSNIWADMLNVYVPVESPPLSLSLSLSEERLGDILPEKVCSGVVTAR